MVLRWKNRCARNCGGAPEGTEMARLDDRGLDTQNRDGSEPVTPPCPPMFEMDLNPSPHIAKDGRGGVEARQGCKNTVFFACQRWKRRGRAMPKMPSSLHPTVAPHVRDRPEPVTPSLPPALASLLAPSSRAQSIR